MKISKVIYYSSLTVGGILIFVDHTFWGLGMLFLGLILTVATDPELREHSSTSYTTETEKKPYYKNEFEEYQHYKHCKRHMRK